MHTLTIGTVLAAVGLVSMWIIILTMAVSEPEPIVATHLTLPPVPRSTAAPVVSKSPRSPIGSAKPQVAQVPHEKPSTPSESEWRNRAAVLSVRVSDLEKQLAACRSATGKPKNSQRPSIKGTPRPAPTRSPSAPSLHPLTRVPRGPSSKNTVIIPVLVFTYNRPDRLDRCLKMLSRVMPRGGFHLFVSQDGNEMPQIQQVIDTFISAHRDMVITRILHERDDSGATQEEIDQGWQPYYAIAHHYKSSINRVFATTPQYTRIILLEDDLEISDDFFAMMNATSPMFDHDPKLYCISGFNDNGKPEHVLDPVALYRSDFFPGLGWMTSRQVWNELNPIWPKGFWDDWMRQPDKRKGRSCLRPEVPRSVARCPEASTSGGQFCEHLERMQLNEQPVDWKAFRFDQLYPKQYDAAVARLLEKARPLRTIFEVDSLPAAIQEVKISYSTNEELGVLEEQLGIMTDMKDGIPRTAYHGVVTIRYKGKRLHLVPTQELYVYS